MPHDVEPTVADIRRKGSGDVAIAVIAEQTRQHAGGVRSQPGQHRIARPAAVGVALQNRQQRVPGPVVTRVAHAQRHLHPHARVRVVGQRRDLRQQGVVRVDLCFGEPQRVLAHAAARVPQCGHDLVDPQGAETAQRPERVQPRTRRRVGAEPDGEQRPRGLILSLDQQSLRRVAPPLVGGGQDVDERGERGVTEPGRARGGQPLGGHDAVDASLVVAGADVERLLDRVGDPLGVLDHRAVHVDDIQPAVRTGGQRDRPEPGVAPAEQLRLRLVPARREAGTVWRQDILVHQVHHHVVHEQAALEGRRQRAAAVIADPGPAREAPGLLGMIDPCLGR